MLVAKGYTDQCLNEIEIRALVLEALAKADLAGKRVLIIIPDSTRTAPIPLLFRLFYEALCDSHPMVPVKLKRGPGWAEPAAGPEGGPA